MVNNQLSRKKKRALICSVCQLPRVIAPTADARLPASIMEQSWKKCSWRVDVSWLKLTSI